MAKKTLAKKILPKDPPKKGESKGVSKKRSTPTIMEHHSQQLNLF